MTTSKNELLDLFVICNVPSSTKFQLFCRFLFYEDSTALEYFDEALADKHDLRWAYQLEEGYYDDTNYRYRRIDGSTVIGGFKFGVYDSYEEALDAAKAYTAESLLEKYAEVHSAAKVEAEKKG